MELLEYENNGVNAVIGDFKGLRRDGGKREDDMWLGCIVGPNINWANLRN